jgi:pimeloyl-ACP methyl ester carboxylesterase
VRTRRLLRNRLTSLRHATRIGLAATLFAAIGLIGVAASSAAADQSRRPHDPKPTIVLVHGAFADASGWTDVVARLQARGYPTIAPANPLRGLPSDSAYIKSVIDQIDGPLILVGHSYGGMVITNAAVGDPDVKGLVYVAAFAPAEGDSTGGLSNMFPGTMLTPENLILRDYPTTDPEALGTEGYINPDMFREVFAGDMPRRTTDVMAATQRPAELASLGQPSGPPAWASIPSWFVVARNDNAIPADAQRFMADRAGAIKTVEVRASHVVMMSKPAQVTDLIIDAARHGS